MDKLNVQYMSLDELKEYKTNPRKNEKAIEAVANSIKEFGFKVPIIVDGKNEIIAGHTRLKASRKLGLKKVPVIVAEDLSEAQIKAFRLADNKTGELAEWDSELLNKELDDLFGILDMNDFGFPVQIENIDEDHIGERKIGHELGEADNYVVLRFDTQADWEQALITLGIETVTTNEENKNIRRSGYGRVIDGAEVIERLING